MVAVNQGHAQCRDDMTRLNSWVLMAFSRKPWLRLVKMRKGYATRRTPKELKTGTGKTWYDSYKAKYKLNQKPMPPMVTNAKVVVDAINKVCKMTAPPSVMRSWALKTLRLLTWALTLMATPPSLRCQGILSRMVVGVCDSKGWVSNFWRRSAIYE